MTAFWYYFSPTTPGNPSWTVDLGGPRLGNVPGLIDNAEMGSAGVSSVSFDDPTATLGHNSDAILGLKQFVVNETACPAVGGTSVAPTFGRRLFTGYIGDRKYYRGTPSQSPSLRTGAARIIDITLTDVNAFTDFRIYTPAMTTANRPAETDIARINFFLGFEFLSDTLFNLGLVNTSGPVNLDPADYRAMHPSQWMNDCAQMSGKNFFIYYSELDGHLGLFYDFPHSSAYPADLALTNVESEANATTFYVEPDAVLTRDPSRVVSGALVQGTGASSYQQMVATSYVYGWRDIVAPSANVKTTAKAAALATRYLADNNTEDDRITCTVQLPASKVTGIKAGQLVQAHFSHLPGYESGAFPMRVLRRTVRQDKETNAYYWVDLDLSPNPVTQKLVLGWLHTTVERSATAVPSGWTLIGENHGVTAGPDGFFLAYGPGATGSPQSYTWTQPAGANKMDSVGVQFGGLTGLPTHFASVVHNDDTDTGLTKSISVTTDGPGVVYAGIWIHNFDQPPALITAPGGGWLTDHQSIQTGDPGYDRDWGDVNVGHILVSGAGTTTVTWTLSNQCGGVGCGWGWGAVACFVPGTAVAFIQAAANRDPSDAVTVTFASPL